MLREFKMLYILWREISLSLARGRHILLSCQFFSSLFFVQHSIIFSACLFNKYGYHLSFHRSMMKEFMIISTPDLCCISFYSPMYGERYMTSSSRLFTSEDISQIFPDIGHNSSSEQLVKLFHSFFFISNRVPTKPRVKS